eukprot:350505-Chlamydomonas_euryale.AAC.6
MYPRSSAVPTPATAVHTISGLRPSPRNARRVPFALRPLKLSYIRAYVRSYVTRAYNVWKMAIRARMDNPAARCRKDRKAQGPEKDRTKQRKTERERKKGGKEAGPWCNAPTATTTTELSP